ncbi:Sm-like protein LSM7, partial [Ascoidea rubescens DSM 1968]
KNDGPKRDAILDLSKFKNEKLRVKFIGGREIIGVLKGYDQLMNLVLDNVEESLRDPDDDTVLTEKKRQLNGLVVVRSPLLLTVSPVEGSEVIENPFTKE